MPASVRDFDVEPLAHTVPGYFNETWVVVFAPAGTSAPPVERYNREIHEIASSAELRALLEPDGMVAVPTTPEAFATRIRSELGQWRRVAAERKIVLD